MTHTPGPWTASKHSEYPDRDYEVVEAHPSATASIADVSGVDNAELVTLLQEALPHVEKMADVFATGPVAGPVVHLANDIQTAIAKAQGS